MILEALGVAIHLILTVLVVFFVTLNIYEILTWRK